MSEQSQSENAGRLVGRIEAEAEAECSRILQAARDEAVEIVAGARAQALSRLRAEVADLRRRGMQEVSKMRSRIETERRQLRQRMAAQAQDRGLSRLCAALDALWQDGEARATWAAQALAEARAHLLPGDWRIEHPGGWAEAEKADFAAAVEAHCGRAPEVAASDAMRSGLVIHADTARIDATGPGLCRESTRLRALFQSELDAMEGEAPS